MPSDMFGSTCMSLCILPKRFWLGYMIHSQFFLLFLSFEIEKRCCNIFFLFKFQHRCQIMLGCCCMCLKAIESVVFLFMNTVSIEYGERNNIHILSFISFVRPCIPKRIVKQNILKRQPDVRRIGKKSTKLRTWCTYKYGSLSLDAVLCSMCKTSTTIQ